MNRIVYAISLFALCAGCDRNTKETSTGRVIHVESDDREMNAAMQRARDSFDEFWAEVSTDRRRAIPVLTDTMVKAYFADTNAPDDGEHIWLSEVGYDGKRISGIVASEPLALQETELGEEVSFPLNRLSDWLIIDEGKARGAFTIQLLRGRMSESERADHDANYPFSFSPIE